MTIFPAVVGYAFLHNIFAGLVLAPQSRLAYLGFTTADQSTAEILNPRIWRHEMTKINPIAIIGAFLATLTSFTLALASFPLAVLTA